MDKHFEPLYDEKKLVKYNEFEKKYENNKQDLIVIGNLVGFLQNYIYEVNESETQENLYENKRQALKRITEIVKNISSNRYIYPEYLILMAQSNFMLGNLVESFRFYSELLRQPGIIDNRWKTETDFYSGDQEDVVKIVHNMCLISHMIGKEDNIHYLKEKYRYLIRLEEEYYTRLIMNNPKLKDSFWKEYNDLTEFEEMSIFYYDKSIDSPILGGDSSFLYAMYEDAKRNSMPCEIIMDGILKVENHEDSVSLHKINSFLCGRDTVITIQFDNKLRENTNGIHVCDEILAQGYEKVEIFGQSVNTFGAIFVKQYFGIVEEVKKAYNELSSILQQQVSECRSQGSGSWATIQTNFWMDIDRLNGAFITDLLETIDNASRDVCPYDDVEENYGKNTKAYRTLQKLRKILVNEAQEISNAYDRQYQAGCDLAFNRAISQIKGMRYGIITNSVIDLLAYEAVSNLSIRSQAQKANQQYEKELKKLVKSADDIYKNRLLSLMFEQYVPTAKEIIKCWSDEVIQIRMEYEKRHGNEIYEDINKCDIEKSQQICDSVVYNDTSAVKKMKLLNAFLACPFNESVYLKTAQLGLMNKNMYTYAYILGGERLSEKIKNEAININDGELSNIDHIKERINFMVDDFDSEVEILSEIYKPYVKKIEGDFLRLNNVILGRISINQYIINDLLIGDVEKFALMTEENIKGEVSKNIDEITTAKIWETILNNRFLSSLDGFNSDIRDYSALCKSYSDSIFKLVYEYWHIINVEMQKIQNEKDNYKKRLEQLMSEMDKMNSELSSLGIFRFKEKKQIKIQSARMDMEIQTVKKEMESLHLEWK